ncbi:MAG TPA: rhodanese-like domain-containing protein [Jatrophihabitans sp.]|nr:rhodanese-like domain-containing protein [Jatrophihabitans sp.]
MTNFGLAESSIEATPSIERDQIQPGQVILDVRQDEEWVAGHIDGAVHVPLDQLPNRMLYEPGELLSDEALVVTCKGGGRARRAVTWLNRNGFDAVVLAGGMRGWLDAGHLIVSETGDEPMLR